MKRTILIGRWVVDFLFFVDKYDVEGVLACLWDCGATRGILMQAEDLMKTCEANCGFTFANPELFRAVVVVGPTSSSDEFIDTLVHEIHHLAVAIASELGIDLEGETPAYISGDFARALASTICELGCPHCSGDES